MSAHIAKPFHGPQRLPAGSNAQALGQATAQAPDSAAAVVETCLQERLHPRLYVDAWELTTNGVCLCQSPM